MGGVAAQMVLANMGPGLSPAEHAILRQVIWRLAQWVTGPSLALVLLSGVLAMAFHRAFQNAQWVMVKVLMTPLLLEGSFLAILSPARGAARLTQAIADGRLEVVDKLDRLLVRERWGLWVMVVLFTAQIVLGVWRPKLADRRPSRHRGDRQRLTYPATAARKMRPGLEPRGRERGCAGV